MSWNSAVFFNLPQIQMNCAQQCGVSSTNIIFTTLTIDTLNFPDSSIVNE